MRAVVLRAFGGPEELKVEELPQPIPAPDEVLLRVRACGVCHLDMIVRSGMRSRLKLPLVLGHEIAGEIVEIGSAVTGFKAGDRVASINYQACGDCKWCRAGRPSLCLNPRGEIGQVRQGGYAEYVALPRANLVRLPDGLPFEYACLGACCFAPPYKAIRQVGRVRPGDTVVVTGASGGLGMAAIQIARLSGARTIGITTSVEKADRLKALGADEVIVNGNGSFGDEVRNLTGGAGADLVVDTVGSAVFPGPLRGLARGGRYVVIGELRGKPVEINLALVILKEWEIYGVESASRDDLHEILHFMHHTGLKPTIWKTMALEAAAEAHRKLTDRQVVGRIILTP
jgi:D-arabinose 1-dehydrogenase-like Zn-dependent alcohol dehydrogenase